MRNAIAGWLLTATWISLTPFIAFAANEAKVFIVTTWDDDCSGTNRPEWDDMCDAWYDAITNYGIWDDDGHLLNGQFRDGKFTDVNVVPWGQDQSYLDDADAALVCTHGGINLGRYRAKMRVDESGGGNCYASSAEMSLGDNDLEFLHLSSCHSLDDITWFGSFSWKPSMDGLQLLAGFHGCMWINEEFDAEYGGMASYGYSWGISDGWIDLMYMDDGDDEQCPVVYVEGNTLRDAQNRHDDLVYSYSPSYSDPTGAVFTAKYVNGCDPLCEDECGEGA